MCHMCHILQGLAEMKTLMKSTNVKKNNNKKLNSPPRSSQVIGMLCFAAVSVISCLYSRPAVLFSFTQHMTSEPNPSRPSSRAALHRSVLVSCSECPSRCYTELPPSVAGRLRSCCNQAVHACYQTAWLGGCVSTPNSCSPAT